MVKERFINKVALNSARIANLKKINIKTKRCKITLHSVRIIKIQMWLFSSSSFSIPMYAK